MRAKIEATEFPVVFSNALEALVKHHHPVIATHYNSEIFHREPVTQRLPLFSRFFSDRARERCAL